MKHSEIALGSTLAVVTFLEAHPYMHKMLGAILIAIVSSIASKLVERLFGGKKS